MPCLLQRAGLALALELSPILSTLQNLMQTFPAPDPAISVSSMIASATPIDALPTWSLIARAWCGLLIWAVSECSPGGTETVSAEGSGEELCKGGIKPVSRLLQWLLVTSSSIDRPAAAVDKGNSTCDLAEWKGALIVTFVGILSSLKGFREGVDEWMKLPVQISIESRPAEAKRSESICWDCEECAAARDVQAFLLKDLGDVDDSLMGVTVANRERGDKQPAASVVPFWVALALGVLGGRCDQHASDGHLQPGKCAECCRGHGGTVSCGSGTSSESILTEVLALSPPECPARLLASLARGSIDRPPTKRAEVDANEKSRMRRFLTGLGRAWCAEAVRNISDWKSLTTPLVEGDSSVSDRVDQVNCFERGHDCFDALPNSVDQQQPDAELLESTAHALRTLLKSAVRFLHSPFPFSEAMEGVKGPRESKAFRDEPSVRLFRSRSRENKPSAECCLDERGKKYVYSPVEEAFGSRVGKLWRCLFALRRRHLPGLPSLMKRIARDCAVLLFSCGPDRHRSRQTAMGSSCERTIMGVTRELEGKAEAWGFEISQSQSQSRRGTREIGMNALEHVNSSGKDSSGDSNGTEMLSRPPPFEFLPIVTAAAQALLEYAVAYSTRETDTTRKRALGTALAMLAWALTSITSITEAGQPLSSTSDVLSCLRALRGIDASGQNIARRELAFPLDEVSLAPVSRLVAVGLRQSFATYGDVSSGFGLPSAEMCVAASPDVRQEIMEVAMCVLAGVKGFRKDFLSSLSALRTLTPMLEAVLEMPISR